jgi:hypothetical protein
MPSIVRQSLLIVAFGSAACLATGAARADDVTIYRCVDGSGKVALQDRPCPKDVHQDVREMIRPQDPPPRPQPTAAVEPPPPRAVEVRVVHDREPPPTWQCTTPDGSTYTNHSGIPQGRYVPTWTYGYGVGLTHAGDVARPHADSSPSGARPHGGGRGGYALPGMTYVEDTCVRLRRDEICQAMHDRIDALGTLFFNGQPSDRARYERERQGLEEDIRDQCSGE